jgi:hypothetical protein
VGDLEGAHGVGLLLAALLQFDFQREVQG